jgi:hypothetical protein
MIGILGFPAMAALGVVLGLIGAGGSILVVPILVYLFGIPASQATGYSLLIVGTTALFGAIEYLRRKQSNIRMAAVFGFPAIVGVYVTRRYLFPAIPDPVVQASGFLLSKDTAVMVLFAAFMLLAAVSMLRGGEAHGAEEDGRAMKFNLAFITGLGLAVGVFTGLVGAGGGFMILPVLVLMGGLPVKIAIGTDLIIIAAKSLIGFVGEVQAAEAIDFGFLGMIMALPLVGMALGTWLNKRAYPQHLRTGFGWFVLVMGSYIVVRELLLA